jgi:inosine-uridine nucleoside N-ribohydrolase
LVLLLSTTLAAPVPIIFDTDMDTDCDDAGALAVLHALADRGECDILATMVSVSHPWSAPTVAAINAWYGRPNLPVGNVKGGGVNEPSRYTRQIAEAFPQPIRSAADAPDALPIYREILAKQPDHSVVIVTVGYLRNLKNLLESPGGPELVQRKVKTYVCMGGNFIGTPAHDDLKLGNVNFQRDPDSVRYVVAHWPTPLVFVGREIGSVPSGLTLGTSLAKTPPTNPVRQAYEHYFGGTLKNRHVADLVTVLYAVRGLRDYWDIHPGGHLDLQPDLTFTWQDQPDRHQSYLLKKQLDGHSNDRAIESTLDELLLQPPR